MYTDYLIFFQLQTYHTHSYHKVIFEKHVGTMHLIITYHCALFHSGTQQNILRSIAKFALWWTTKTTITTRIITNKVAFKYLHRFQEYICTSISNAFLRCAWLHHHFNFRAHFNQIDLKIKQEKNIIDILFLANNNIFGQYHSIRFCNKPISKSFRLF